MKYLKPTVLVTLAILSPCERSARAQDNVRGGPEPIVISIDTAKLTYDYLVDGTLLQDDPTAKKFKTLQAAYAAAPEGTEAKPTVIGIRPNVYLIAGTSARGASLSITKSYITLLGLTNNRRTVVLADNRGLMQGASDDGYIIDVNATGFTAKNLTIINYCNTDYEYPGDPGKNLHKRSDVITQGVALQSSGDKHVYENVALLGRLDTMFLRTTRSYFKNVYVEGTDDWMGGGQLSVWENCTLVYPTGSGVNDRQVLSGVFKASTHVTLKVSGTSLAVSAYNDIDKETLALEGTITPNRFGGAGVSYPRGSSVIYSRFEISYPGAGPAK